MKVLVLLLIPACLAFACKKHKSDSQPAFSGNVQLSNPHEGDTLTGNFTVSGLITANREMHGYHVGVYRSDNEDLIYENQYHSHASNYTIDELVNHSLTETTNLKVVVEVVVEHEGENLTKTVNFVYKPE